MTEDEIVEAMLIAANDVANDDDTNHAGAMRAALRIAIPWVREQALREAAIVSQEVEVTVDNVSWQAACQAVEKRLLALIPAHPSQTDA